MTDTAFSDQTDSENVRPDILKPVELRHSVLKSSVVFETAGRKNLGCSFKTSCNVFGSVGIGADGDDLTAKLPVALNNIRAGV